jgi:hypothetical protein
MKSLTSRRFRFRGPGDVWLLGAHRIACGDSRDAGLVKSLFAGAAPQLMVTDPPYGVEYDPEWRHRRGVNNSARKGKIKNDEIADWTPTWQLYPGEIAYVWHGALRSTIVAESLANSGFTIRAQIVWAKERLVMSRATITGNMSPAGTLFAKRATGPATASRRRFGRSAAADRTPRQNTRPKSRSNACAGPW